MLRWDTGTLAWVVWDGSLTTGVLVIGAVTQSGTWTVQPGNTANTTAWKVDNSAVTQPVSAAGLTNLDVLLSSRLKPADTLAAVTNLAQMAGVALLMNEGAAGTGAQRVVLGTTATTSQNPIGAVTLGNTLGKVNQLKTGTLTTTATTADQVVLTFTTTAGKTFYVQYLDFEAALTTISATGVALGTISLESAAGTKLITNRLINPTTSEADSRRYYFNEPIPIAASTVIRVVCTPGATTSTIWRANFGGYEK